MDVLCRRVPGGFAPESDEEAAKLIDMDEVKDEAIRQCENAGIIFIDEIDKVASSGSKNGGSRQSNGRCIAQAQ